jgi:hypothetical protein
MLLLLLLLLLLLRCRSNSALVCRLMVISTWTS